MSAVVTHELGGVSAMRTAFGGTLPTTDDGLVSRSAFGGSATTADQTPAGRPRTSQVADFQKQPLAPPSHRQGDIRELRLVADAEEDLDTSTLEREFPTVAVARAERHESGDLVIDDFAWRGAFDFRRFDEVMEQTRPLPQIAIRGADAVGVAIEVLARFQRLVARRNHASSSTLFDAVLDAHTLLFDASIPMAQADFEHALDTWQWLLRLKPDVGLAPQLAALFHDVDRLECEPHERLEHRAHRTLDDVEKEGGGERVLAILRTVGVGEDEARRARDLVTGGTQGDPDAMLLDDADGLSFLSLMSPKYADHFGLAQTRRKVSFMLGRLGQSARAKVSLIRLRPDDRLLQQG